MALLGCVACSAPALRAQGAVPEAGSNRAWQEAVAARQAFELEPLEEHTRDEFAQVMDNFRAIYHGNPGDLHAPRAVAAVAELLAEQGRELKDPKSVRAAAGQYEFLAKAYPGSSLARPGLEKALALLGPDEADDPGEAAKVRAELGDVAGVEERRSPSGMTARGGSAGESVAGVEERRSPSGMTAKRTAVVLARPEAVARPVAVARPEAVARPVVVDGFGAAAPAPAVVTGIRHWSTATYTRVAIDLGGEVTFEAARTEHPDRIFFDLHGAKLAAGLVGRTFAVTDGGFLKTIRAAQAGPDVTRVVLDVDPVAQYSAFLLPNPDRLVIDIHGKPAAQEGTPGAGGAGRGEEPKSAAEVAPQGMASRRAVPADADAMAVGDTAAQTPLSRKRVSPAADPDARAVGDRESVTPEVAGGASSLPPMPVTDGSAGFGLPARRDAPLNAMAGEPGSGGTARARVAPPRVVVPTKPTVAKPVPNTVTSATPEGSREVASVSEAPGVMEATARPTSGPVVDKGSGSREQETGNRVQGPAGSSHGSGRVAVPVRTASRVNGAPVVPPPPTADGQSTLMRALGLKIGRIVIDAGHGGHDSGTLGPDGIEEKDVVLDVALRLGKLLHDRLGAEVVYTRADDTFIPLETRTAIANKAQADLFISVHANSSQDPDARGVEVYYLNFTSDPEAMQVASRENAVSSARVTQLSDLVKKIALKDKIDESRELAADVDTSLYAGLKKGNAGLKDRGVKKAPFVVLIGANMPSILAEISFVTNPDDAAELETPAYRERVAESLYNGVARYAGAINSGLSPKPKTRVTERAER